LIRTAAGFFAARHEASHAAFAMVVFGLGCISTVTRHRCTTIFPRCTVSSNDALGLLAAGMVGVQLSGGHDHLGDRDLAAAHQLMEKLPGHGFVAWKDALHRAEKIVRARLVFVEVLAREIEHEDVLSGQRVDRIWQLTYPAEAAASLQRAVDVEQKTAAVVSSIRKHYARVC
jgi:hypothetical protein